MITYKGKPVKSKFDRYTHQKCKELEYHNLSLLFNGKNNSEEKINQSPISHTVEKPQKRNDLTYIIKIYNKLVDR